jgi:hypothetical protein
VAMVRTSNTMYSLCIEAERGVNVRHAHGGARGMPRPPNTRVQRTRSSPSAPHSPVTRLPLGGLGDFEADPHIR